MTFSRELSALQGPALWQRFAALCQDAARTQEQLLLEAKAVIAGSGR